MQQQNGPCISLLRCLPWPTVGALLSYPSPPPPLLIPIPSPPSHPIPPTDPPSSLLQCLPWSTVGTLLSDPDQEVQQKAMLLLQNMAFSTQQDMDRLLGWSGGAVLEAVRRCVEGWWGYRGDTGGVQGG